MCIICGKGFAVTTEGTCGMCDELATSAEPSRRSEWLLIGMSGSIVLGWTSIIVLIGSLAG
jgi:hypothetical protein